MEAPDGEPRNQPRNARLFGTRRRSYETPPAAVLALLGAESLPHCIWEPAAGRGAIVEVLRSAGHEVTASDIRDHGDHRCPGIATGIDFYKTLVAPGAVDCIVTNTPFRESGPERFVSHGLELCRRVIILARLTFMESKRPILESGAWVRAMPFKSRLPMMHRDGWNGRKATNPNAFAWFVFDRDHDGSDATVHRLSLEREEKSNANHTQLSLFTYSASTNAGAI
jgi:hypothetical protein